MKNQKLLTMMGLFLSLALIITGIVILFQSPDWHHLGGGKEDGVEFGADFYTYIYGSANNIANNTYSGAKILLSMFSVLKLSLGLAFIFAGLFSGLHFAKDVSLGRKKEVAPVMECDEAAAETEAEKTDVLTE